MFGHLICHCRAKLNQDSGLWSIGSLNPYIWKVGIEILDCRGRTEWYMMKLVSDPVWGSKWQNLLLEASTVQLRSLRDDDESVFSVHAFITESAIKGIY